MRQIGGGKRPQRDCALIEPVPGASSTLAEYLAAAAKERGVAVEEVNTAASRLRYVRQHTPASSAWSLPHRMCLQQ